MPRTLPAQDMTYMRHAHNGSISEAHAANQINPFRL